MHDNFFQIKNYTINQQFFPQSKYLNLNYMLLASWSSELAGRIGEQDSVQSQLSHVCASATVACCGFVEMFSRLVFTPPTIWIFWALCSVVPAREAELAFARLFYADVCWHVSVVRFWAINRELKHLTSVRSRKAARPRRPGSKTAFLAPNGSIKESLDLERERQVCLKAGVSKRCVN